MANTFKLEVITASELFYSGEIEMVVVRTLLGEEGFMAGHSWACKLLDTGVMRIQESEEKDVKWAAISKGYIDVKDYVVVYTDLAERAEDIDVEDAEKDKAEAESYISINESNCNTDADVEKLAQARAKLKWAEARLKVAESLK
ncbi:MAG: ATP synthase F1 subunit epsilon [Eubacteriales bacterium]|nr:ATP synthase F1 subunit epsilon [Eubacteriales bacterium]MDD4390373.1 ATP synthase F1 subunit epsilon [Eubacteriales bacterium]